MTKVRPPLTFELALAKVAGLLGWSRVAEIAGRTERQVRNWSDPDATGALTLDHALALDVAFRQAGGEGAPLFQCYATRLEVETNAACADAHAQAARVATAAKEAGEAISAQILACRPGASPASRELARRETEEAIGALTNTLPDLGAGPGSSVSGSRGPIVHLAAAPSPGRGSDDVA